MKFLAALTLATLAGVGMAQAKLDFTALYTSDGAKYGVATDLAPLTLDGAFTISAVAATDPDTGQQVWLGGGLSWRKTLPTGLTFGVHAGLTSAVFKKAEDVGKPLAYFGLSVRY